MWKLQDTIVVRGTWACLSLHRSPQIGISAPQRVRVLVLAGETLLSASRFDMDSILIASKYNFYYCTYMCDALIVHIHCWAGDAALRRPAEQQSWCNAGTSCPTLSQLGSEARKASIN